MSRRPDPMEERERRYRERLEGIVRPDDVDAQAVMKVLRVPPELAGTRLDRFVQSQLRATSRTRSQRIVSASAYSSDGRPLKKNRRLAAEERIVLWRAPWDEQVPDMELPPLYEDGELLAVNKPPYLVVHPTARHHRMTVAMLLAESRPDEHLTLVHRIDRETSGVLLLAKTRAADRAVKIQLEERKDVVKRYLALAWGWPSWERFAAEMPIEEDASSRYRVKMRVAAPGTGLPAATTFEVVGRRARGDGRRYALIRCTLHTGRQHQIRVHLAALGLPVVGDKLYGPDDAIHARAADHTVTEEDLVRLEIPRHALHASELEIDHPRTGARVSIQAPLYADLQAFWDALEVSKRVR